MFVRPMDVHQPLAQGGEDVQGRGRAVNELPVGAGAGEGAFQDELVVLARLQTVLLQERLQRGFEPGHVEDCLDRATVAATADKRAVGALAQREVQRADEDGLPCAGLAGDDVVARLPFKGQVGHQGEVLNAQGRQHVAIPALNVATERSIGKRKVGAEVGTREVLSGRPRRVQIRSTVHTRLVRVSEFGFPSDFGLRFSDLAPGSPPPLALDSRGEWQWPAG